MPVRIDIDAPPAGSTPVIRTAHNPDFGEWARRMERDMARFMQRHRSPLGPSETWVPAINAYRLPDCIEVCVDLAGVDKAKIQIHVEPGRLMIRGERIAPQPHTCTQGGVQILAMEIDHGPFERSLVLPANVNTEHVTAEQTNGLLWITLPIGKR